MLRSAAYASLLLLLLGCAGKNTSSVTPPPVPATANWIRDDKVIPMLHPAQANPHEYRTQVHEVVAPVNKKVQRCYTKELRERPRLHGEMVVSMAVAADGAVQKVWVSYSSVPSLDLEACVLPLFEGLKLPPPETAGQEVRYPYVFTSKRTPPEITQALRRLHHLEDPEDWADNAPQGQEADEFDAPW